MIRKTKAKIKTGNDQPPINHRSLTARKTRTERAAMKPTTPKTEPPPTQLRKAVFGGSHQLTRRDLLKTSAAAAVGLALSSITLKAAYALSDKNVRMGFVGTGGRGTMLLDIMLRSVEGVEIVAVCDLDEKRVQAAQNLVVSQGRKKPEAYFKDEYAYIQLMERDDIDAVIIATPWDWHAKMAVHAMKSGKYAGVEVPCVWTLDECWDLVNTHEKTKIPCMMLENWSFRKDNLAVLNMIRQGLFGEIIHCHCAHSHNCVDHWFFDAAPWSAKFLEQYNRDQYPCHQLGRCKTGSVNCLSSLRLHPSGVRRSEGERSEPSAAEPRRGEDAPRAKNWSRAGHIGFLLGCQQTHPTTQTTWPTTPILNS